MKIRVGKNFKFLYDNFTLEKCKIPQDKWVSGKHEKQGFVFEGGSGSTKTWDIIQFLIYYCQANENQNKRILIFRETYADCRETVFLDFITILKMYGIYDVLNHSKSPKHSYNLYGNSIKFSGLEEMGSHGKRNDVIWGNEGMELSQAPFLQLNQRCNELFIVDYNPSFTQHWIYDKITSRPDVLLFKTTLLDNPFLPSGQRDEILRYEPTEENMKNGTADQYMWDVYGLGKKGALTGQIFKNVQYIDEFPEGLAFSYGLDFGFTVDPCALTKNAHRGNDIFILPLSYEPIDTPESIDLYLTKIGIKKDVPITADSSDKHSNEKGTVEMVKSLKSFGWSIKKVSKTQDLNFWVREMKSRNIFVIKKGLWQKAKLEFENYCWKVINDLPINQPEDRFNHIIDSSRYDLMARHKGRIRSGTF